MNSSLQTFRIPVRTQLRSPIENVSEVHALKAVWCATMAGVSTLFSAALSFFNLEVYSLPRFHEGTPDLNRHWTLEAKTKDYSWGLLKGMWGKE